MLIIDGIMEMVIKAVLYFLGQLRNMGGKTYNMKYCLSI
jgi:hypothetical protein